LPDLRAACNGIAHGYSHGGLILGRLDLLRATLSADLSRIQSADEFGDEIKGIKICIVSMFRAAFSSVLFCRDCCTFRLVIPPGGMRRNEEKMNWTSLRDALAREY
jgi:hypothetical protein